MSPNTASELATYISVWFWQDVFVCLVGTFLIVGQFLKNRKPLLIIVVFLTFMIVCRLFATHHILIMKTDEAELGPTRNLKVLWTVYYLLYAGLVTAVAFRIKELWKGNHWLNQAGGVLIVFLMLVSGFYLVYKPYCMIYGN